MTKHALVTGAASGIGKATATGLAKAGFDVTLLVRSAAKGDATKADILRAAPGAKLDVLVCDLASQRSIRDAAAKFTAQHGRLDVLVCAAGVFLPQKTVTEDGLEATFATNVIGYYLLADLLAPALQKAAPARVVFVSSKYGNTKIPFEDLQFEKRAYSYLKSTPPTMLGRVLVMQELAERWRGSVTVNAVHPGLVANTQLLSQTGGFFRWVTNAFGGTPEEGADTVLWLATAPEAANETGKMWTKRKVVPTPGQGSDAAVRKRFWAECERVTAKGRA